MWFKALAVCFLAWVGVLSSPSIAAGPFDFLSRIGGPEPLEAPIWENQVLAHIWISNSDEMLDIKGTDILSMGYVPLEEARRAGIKTEKDRATFEKALHEALAFISLSKIVDQRIKRHMVPELGEKRLRFAVRQILVENAVNCEKVPTIEKYVLVEKLKNEKAVKKTIKIAGPELGLYSDDQLYKWVKECFSAENERAKNDKVPVYGLEFSVDWQYEEGGLSDLRRLMEPVGPSYGLPWWKKDLVLPQFRFMVEKLPDTISEFREIAKRELNAYYHLFARELVWRTTVADRYYSSIWNAAHIVFQDEMKKRYETLRGFNEFIPGEKLEATLIDIKFSGPLAGEARTRLRQWIDEKVNTLAAEIAEDNKNAGPNPIAPLELLRKIRVTRLMLNARARHGSELVEKLKVEFASAIASGALSVSFSERGLQYDNSRAIPPVDSVEARELKLAFSPMIRVIPFPFFDTTSESGEVHVRLLKRVHGQKLKDIVVEDSVRDQIVSKQLGYYSRAMIQSLFEENRVFVLKDTCSDSKWPCIKVDPRAWADHLLSEVPYPSESENTGPVSFEFSDKLRDVMKFKAIPFREAEFVAY
ncbi:MAG: hypothetical protein AABZ55_06420 [Bdellovibrionota bacterium]